jgi:Asparagine synthase
MSTPSWPIAGNGDSSSPRRPVPQGPAEPPPDEVRRAFDRYKPTELEILAGGFLGRDPEVPPIRGRPRGIPPLSALEEVTSDCLARAPCFVSFSGGVDSSVVLSVAARTARRQGLALPVPVTLRFPGREDTEESKWQETVVGNLGLDEWVRLEVGDELEALGPVATSVLLRHGVLAPPNAYFHVPMIELARGGSLMTGVGGDELFLGGPARIALLLSGSARPVPRDILRVGLAMAPRGVRLSVRCRREPVDVPWLTDRACRKVTRELHRFETAQPIRWGPSIRAYWTGRYLQGSRAVLAGLGIDHDVRVVHPFFDPRFLLELLHVGGTAGFGSRTEAVRVLFGEAVAPQVLERTTKATFDSAVWGERVREFAGSWSGVGVDPYLVDTAALRTMWSELSVDYRTLLLLQSAWLATQGGAPAQDA